MARTGSKKEQQPDNGATTGYESELWEMANALRGAMDAAIAGNLKTLRFPMEGERTCWSVS